MSDPAQTTILDLEKYKFVSTGPTKQEIALKVTNPDGSTVGVTSNPFAPPPTTVSFVVTYPSATQEVYSFYDGPGGSGTLLQTITLNYTNASKQYLLDGEVS